VLPHNATLLHEVATHLYLLRSQVVYLAYLQRRSAAEAAVNSVLGTQGQERLHSLQVCVAGEFAGSLYQIKTVQVCWRVITPRDNAAQVFRLSYCTPAVQVADILLKACS
jgi:hypothetical protein